MITRYRFETRGNKWTIIETKDYDLNTHEEFDWEIMFDSYDEAYHVLQQIKWLEEIYSPHRKVTA